MKSADPFESVVLLCGRQRVKVFDHIFDVSPRGMTFKTNTYFSPFTDLRIRLTIPPAFGGQDDWTIHCDGVVVECRGNHKKKIYFVTVAFLNLSKAEEKQLAITHQILPKMLRQPAREPGSLLALPEETARNPWHGHTSCFLGSKMNPFGKDI